MTVPELEQTDEQRASAAERESAAQDPRGGGRVVPRAAGVAGGRPHPAADRRARRQRTPPATTLGSASRRPARRAASRRCSKPGFSRRSCFEPACVVQREDGRSIDRFRNRLMIPICRDTGAVIALAAARSSRSAAEVPELARNPDLHEGPDALRPEPDEGGRSGEQNSLCWSRAISTSPRSVRPGSSPSWRRAARR